MFNYRVIILIMFTYRVISLMMFNYRVISLMMFNYRVISLMIFNYRVISLMMFNYRVICLMMFNYRVISLMIFNYRVISLMMLIYRVISLMISGKEFFIFQSGKLSNCVCRDQYFISFCFNLKINVFLDDLRRGTNLLNSNSGKWIQPLRVAFMIISPQVTFVENPQMKINSLKKQKPGFLIHNWSDKAFRGTVVNRALSYLLEVLHQITNTVPSSTIYLVGGLYSVLIMSFVVAR